MADRPIRLVLRIDLDWADIQAYYQGEMPRITALAKNGQQVVMPTTTLRNFLHQDGVHGYFAMIYDSHSKRILSFEPVD
ncbi:hypothetical protein J2T60_002381 [Natronospira proteinivora]|uniref:DUF2835 family protein n=1 Tax=Natronospira proteinivora TaxID=1807133 RepID=A0ABT1GAM4_9GAMM|nr:DUF2835 family protein [Natronospira proteinivora]MCP1728381.1 hypothetical protein [Natronospira proteinivora]